MFNRLRASSFLVCQQQAKRSIVLSKYTHHAWTAQYRSTNLIRSIQTVNQKTNDTDSLTFYQKAFANDIRYEEELAKANKLDPHSKNIIAIAESAIKSATQPESFARHTAKFLIRVTLFLAIGGAFIYFYYVPEMGNSSIFKALEVTDVYKQATNTSTTFNDVHGIDSVKHELEAIVEFLKDPEKFRAAGAKVPKGILLYGPPGTGKTLLARAMANEAGVNFYYANASSFEEMLVGKGSKRVANLFEMARKNAPCIVYVDELDGLGGSRDKYSVNSPSLALNQLLSELDGFDPTVNIIFIASSNRPEALDSALLRPGRIDKSIAVSLPSKKGREDILRYYLSKVRADPALNPSSIASITTGFSGAQLENLINTATIGSVLRNSESVTQKDLDAAYTDIVLGIARPLLNTDEEKRYVAIHESGHAITSALTSKGSVHLVTIVPRGMSLGSTHALPRDEYRVTKADLLANLDVAHGGFIAEELFSGENNVSTGAAHDNQAANKIIERYLRAGFGNLRCTVEKKDLSPASQELMENEAEKLKLESQERVRNLLRDNWKYVEILSERLVKNETVDAKELVEILELNESEVKIVEQPIEILSL